MLRLFFSHSLMVILPFASTNWLFCVSRATSFSYRNGIISCSRYNQVASVFHLINFQTQNRKKASDLHTTTTHERNAYNHQHACEFYFFAFSFLLGSHLLTRTNKIITEHFEREVFSFLAICWVSCTKSNIGVELCNEQQNNKAKESLVVNWIIRYPGAFFSSINTPVPL